MRLPVSPKAPAQARAGVSRLSEVLDDRTFADLQLVLSELVTNSAKYGPGEPINVSVRCVGDKVNGGVNDRSRGKIDLPQATQTGGAELGKWGLAMVDRVAADWGLRDADRTVWFRLES
jgi:two-component sensor histidine kinase